MKFSFLKRIISAAVAGAIVLPSLMIGSFAAEAVYSSDFEKDNGGWTSRGSTTVTRDKDAKEGTYSLKVNGRSASWHGASLEGKLLKPGEVYSVSCWAKQTTGQTINLHAKYQYSDDKGTAHYDGITFASLPNNKWTKLEGEALLAVGATGVSVYFELGDSNQAFVEGDFYIDSVVVTGVKAEIQEPKDLAEYYDEMVKNSLINKGNNTRIKNAIAKAKKGEDVTIAYIGGSITEGANATTPSQCYAYLSYESFKNTYGKGDGSNVHYVNAGMSGTPSSLGVIRYESDVLRVAESAPDIVFIEFAVNDGDDTTGGAAYESLIRNILKADNKPAVVLLFSVFRNGLWNLQSKYIPLGEKYKLPMVSIQSAIAPKINSGVMTNDQFFAADGLHPTNQGHKLMADCITYMFKTLNKAKKASADIKIPTKALLGKDYEGIQLVDSTTKVKGLTITKGSFTAVDKNTGTFFSTGKSKLSNNWKHESTAANKAFKIKTTCKNLMLSYKLSNSSLAGKAEVYVDGKLVTTLNSYSSSGWNNATTTVIFNDTKAKSHTVEIKMAADSTAKEFTILALGYTA